MKLTSSLTKNVARMQDIIANKAGVSIDILSSSRKISRAAGRTMKSWETQSTTEYFKFNSGRKT